MIKFESSVTKDQRGFSLIEMMIALAIIGILSSLALPKIHSYQAKSKQAEAKKNLAHLFTLQISYHDDTDTFAPVPINGRVGCRDNPIGFTVAGCEVVNKVRYNYDTQGATGLAFLASAGSPAGVMIQNCESVDLWTINQRRAIVEMVNAVSQCY